MAPKKNPLTLQMKPCTYGARLAVPLTGVSTGGSTWTATIDDVRSFVDALHEVILGGVDDPSHDYFLNLLGTAQLSAKKPPMYLSHLGGCTLVILGAYKFRNAFAEALRGLMMPGGSDVLRAIALGARELDAKCSLCNCVDVLCPEIRGGLWWARRGQGDENATSFEKLTQEQRAWNHLGATPRDLKHACEVRLEKAEKRIANLEQTHGGADPLRWLWGVGEAFPSVFEADEGKREHESLKWQLRYLQEFRDSLGSSESNLSKSRAGEEEDAASAAGPAGPAGPAGSAGSAVAERERSRSPTQRPSSGGS
jgi:hypothetical protein